MKHEKDENGPWIHGNLLSIVLQRAYHNGGETEVFKVAKECVQGLTADQLIAVATGNAKVDGDSVTGFVYKDGSDN